MTTETIGAMAVPAPPSALLAKLIIGWQALLWGGYFLGVHGLLALAAFQRGGLTFYPFTDPAYPVELMTVADPKDVIGGPLGMALHIPLVLVTFIGPFVGVLALAAGAMLLLQDWRSRRPLKLMVIGSTVLTAVFVIIPFTPWGQDVGTWMAD